MSGFTDDGVTAAVESGILHPGATRQALTSWRNCRRSQHRDAEHASTATHVVHAVIRQPSNAPQELRDAVDEFLDSLGEFADIEITYPHYDSEEREDYRRRGRPFLVEADASLRSAARKRVAEIRAEKLEGGPDYIAEKVWRRQHWPYSSKDVAISTTASAKRVRDVLDRIGKGEEYDQMLEEAYRHARQVLSVPND